LSYISLVTDTTSPTYPYYVPAGPGFNDLTFTTIVPTPKGNKTSCKVRVQAYNNANVLVGSDVSDLPFAITVLQLTSPNGGEILNSRTTPTVPVNFTIYGQNGVANAAFSYSIDGGLTWPAIGTMTGGLAPGSHSYIWNNVPAVAVQKNARVKVVIKNAAGASLGMDQSNATFTITPVYKISGVVTKSGVALPGVTMTLSGDASDTATTDATGRYIFTKLLNGSYTVTASKSGFTFTPATADVSVSGANKTANFTATLLTYSISGTVNGDVQQGVTVKLTGAAAKTTTTDAYGNYSFSGLVNGNYTVTPSKTGYTFLPVNTPVTINNANSSGNNFVSSAISLPGNWDNMKWDVDTWN
jgi:hypothetical protein